MFFLLFFFPPNKYLIACLGGKCGPICRAFSSVSFPPTLSGGLAQLSPRTLRQHPLQSNHNFNKQFVAVRSAQSDQSFSRRAGGGRDESCPPCKHVLAPLLRSETMWHKVTCFRHGPAASQFVTPLGIPKKWVRKMGAALWRGRRRRRGGRVWGAGGDHMFGDVSGHGEDEKRPPNRQRGVTSDQQSAEFLTPRSRGQPDQLLKAQAPVPAGVQFAETSKSTGRSEVTGKEQLPIRWILSS